MATGYPSHKLANLIIAGVNKAGSTSLFHYLSSHPDVCGSRDKETCYFLPVLYNKSLPPISRYEKQFAHCQGNRKYRLEASPGYMTGGSNMARTIAQVLDDVRILIILKDPVYRLVSFYKRKKTTLQLPKELTFREYVKRCSAMSRSDLYNRDKHIYSAMITGIYADFITPWLEVYGGNIKVVFFDDLKSDPVSFMTDIATWLDIDPSIYADYDFDVKNKSMNYNNRFLQQVAVYANNAGKRIWRSNPRLKKRLLNLYYQVNGKAFGKDEVDGETLEFLRTFYAPHNQRLKRILTDHGQHQQTPAWLGDVTVLV